MQAWMPNEDSEEPGMYVPECMCIKKGEKDIWDPSSRPNSSWATLWNA